MKAFNLPGVEDISEDLRRLLRPLSAEQLRYFVVRLRVPTDAEAAREIGVCQDTIINWKTRLLDEHGIDLDELRRAVAVDGVVTAFEILRKAAPLAAQVMVDGLTDPDRWVRLQSAREVLEREGVRQSDVLELGVTDKLATILRRDMAPWAVEEPEAEAPGLQLLDGPGEG
jgi:hypothetical protein